MEIVDLLPAIVAGAIWGWIWFRTFRTAGYARPGWLTVLMMLPLTALPTLVWFIFREIQVHRRVARADAGTAETQSGRGWPSSVAGTETTRKKPDSLERLGGSPIQIPIDVTKLEYRVWRQPELDPDDEITPMKGQMSVADFHFRLNAEESGIQPLSIATQIHWTGEAECRFMIEAPAPEEGLSMAWEKSVVLIGLQTELATKDV